MDRMEHVRRPVVEGVGLQVVGGREPPIEGGTVCITAFFLIFSTRKQSTDELTVSFGVETYPQPILLPFYRFCILQ